MLATFITQDQGEPSMRIHVVQHAPFEGPGLIAEWVAERGHEFTCAMALTEEFPPAESIDFLIVLGGPMGAADDDAYPWLIAEKRFIAEAIAAGRLVLGVCLGSQILASVLGGSVRKNRVPEIGWFEVALSSDAADEPALAAWPPTFTVGQWHGDTFELPQGLPAKASSNACENQLFVFDRRTVGMQFHLEWNEAALSTLIATCAADLEAGGEYVMSAERIKAEAHMRIATCRSLLFALLDGMQAFGPGVAGE